jgi:hypothetical protein
MKKNWIVVIGLLISVAAFGQRVRSKVGVEYTPMNYVRVDNIQRDLGNALLVGQTQYKFNTNTFLSVRGQLDVTPGDKKIPMNMVIVKMQVIQGKFELSGEYTIVGQCGRMQKNGYEYAAAQCKFGLYYNF